MDGRALVMIGGTVCTSALPVSSGCGNGWKGLGEDRRDGVH